MTYLKQAFAFVRKWWWVALGVLAAVAAWVVTRSGDETDDRGNEESTVESSKRFIVDKMERAEQDARIEAAKRDVEVEKKKERLDEIKREDDVRKRRDQLAGFLSEEL